MMGHLPDISTNYSYSDFRRDLRKALPNLYNAYFLRKCRILRFAGLTSTQDKSLEFRNRVIRTISSLEPKAEGKTKAVDWRIYQVLHSRFVEQFTQDEVSKDLFLSVRQIRRLEVQAIEILADRLWADLFVNKQEPSLLESSTKLLDKKPSNDIWKEINEFSWLENANARQKINFSQMFRSILETIQPLLESRKTQIEFLDSHETIEVSADLITLRQALMTLLTSLSTKLSDCSLSLSICSSNQDQTRVRVCIKVHSRKDELFDILMDDYISIARRLLSISQARLEYKKDDDLSIFIDIPLAEQIPVLVIDDNHDTLLLMERLLTGTHYRFLGLVHSTVSIPSIVAIQPRIIILDVMMPTIDGWEFLGRLRSSPETRSIPVVVCTILPQKELALMLGAIDFLQKPVRKETLLPLLDRLSSGG